MRRMLAAPATFATKSDAQAWLAAKRTDIDRGIRIDDRLGQRPLAAWWTEYRESLPGRLRASTVNNYETAWRRVPASIAQAPVARLTPGQIDAWVVSLTVGGLSASKVRETVGVLRRVLARAVRDGAVLVSPLDRTVVPLPRIEQTEKTILNAEDLAEFVSSFQRLDDRLLVSVLAYTGMRFGEATALRVCDLDLLAGTLTIARGVTADNGHLSFSTPKNHRIRHVSVPRPLLDELRSYVSASARIGETLLFPSRSGGPRQNANFRRDAWEPALRGLNAARGLRGLGPLAVRPHDLRATFASLMVAAGVGFADLQRHLGHADVTTTLAHYTRPIPGREDPVERAVGRLLTLA